VNCIVMQTPVHELPLALHEVEDRSDAVAQSWLELAHPCSRKPTDLGGLRLIDIGGQRCYGIVALRQYRFAGGLR